MSKRARLIWGIGLAAVLLIVLLVAVGVEVFRTESLMKRFGPPPPTGQDCGSIIHSQASAKRTARADATLQVLTCFWNAYQSCRAATMSQAYAATDVGGMDTVTIERRSNHCAVYGQAEGYTNTEHSTTIFLCNHLSKEGDTLQLADCDGIAAFALVPRDTQYDNESYLCGIVGGAHAYGIPQQVEDCFFSAYQNCWTDALEYLLPQQTLATGEVVFIIDNHCGIAYQHNSYLAACASLEQRADGLHFIQCGADGDIFVPSVPSGSGSAP